MTAKIFAENPDNLKKGFVPVALVAGFFLAIGALPQKEDDKLVFFSIPQYIEMYWMQLIITVVLMIILGLIVYLLPRRKFFYRFVSVITAIACIIVMVAGVNFGAVQDGGHDEYIKYAINGSDNLDMEELDSQNEANNLYDDNTFYRIDSSESTDNWCMFWGLSSMRTFHSVVPSSIMTFYESIGQTRDVASRMDKSLYALRGLFSVRYYFNRVSDDEDSVHAETLEGLSGFTYLDTQNDFDIYENQYWIPMGFTYDYYTTDKTVQATTTNLRPNLILEAAVLSKKQIEKYSDILTKYNDELNAVGEYNYYSVCEKKRENSCYYFKKSTDGFEAKINLDEDKLLFFSVPYEDGWTATVNGESVDIDVVNYGFMAIRCPAGYSEIRFSYKTAGLTIGRTVSVVGLGVFVAYIAIGYGYDRRKRLAKAENGETEDETTSEVIDSVPSEQALEEIIRNDENMQDMHNTENKDN
jgi:uncharacterized membrane protein YfhO